LNTKLLLWLSTMLNLGLLGAMVNTYLQNVYFRLWADSIAAPVVGGLSVISAAVGLLAGAGFFIEKMKKQVERVKIRGLTPLERLTLPSDRMLEAQLE
jgi:hypothetical protein